MASTGQASAQAPQEMQSSLILYAMIKTSIIDFYSYDYITDFEKCKRYFENLTSK
jgi:hypothetical protein